jgi:hypothetical protein
VDQHHRGRLGRRDGRRGLGSGSLLDPDAIPDAEPDSIPDAEPDSIPDPDAAAEPDRAAHPHADADPGSVGPACTDPERHADARPDAPYGTDRNADTRADDGIIRVADTRADRIAPGPGRGHPGTD